MYKHGRVSVSAKCKTTDHNEHTRTDQLVSARRGRNRVTGVEGQEPRRTHALQGNESALRFLPALETSAQKTHRSGFIGALTVGAPDRV